MLAMLFGPFASVDLRIKENKREGRAYWAYGLCGPTSFFAYACGLSVIRRGDITMLPLAGRYESRMAL